MRYLKFSPLADTASTFPHAITLQLMVFNDYEEPLGALIEMVEGFHNAPLEKIFKPTPEPLGKISVCTADHDQFMWVRGNTLVRLRCTDPEAPRVEEPQSGLTVAQVLGPVAERLDAWLVGYTRSAGTVRRPKPRFSIPIPEEIKEKTKFVVRAERPVEGEVEYATVVGESDDPTTVLPGGAGDNGKGEAVFYAMRKGITTVRVVVVHGENLLPTVEERKVVVV